MQGNLIRTGLAVAALVTMTATGLGQINFWPAVHYGVGLNPSGFATADFDQDGDMDLVVATNDMPPRLTFLMNEGAAGLVVGNVIELTKDAMGAKVAAGDMNGDQWPDLVLLLPQIEMVWVYLYSDFAGFILFSTEPTGLDPHNLVLADIDGNGMLDIAVANTGSDTVTMMMNFGRPEMKLRTVKTGMAPKHIAVGDLNPQDQDNLGLDLVISNSSARTIWVYFNSSDGEFELRSVVSTGDCMADGLTLGDWNRDGMTDIAVAASGKGKVDDAALVCLNYGGRFLKAIKYPTYSLGTVGLSNADFNGDGYRDLVTADCNSDSLTVLAGRRDGKFAVSGKFEVSTGPDEVLALDLNGDGDVDLVSLNSASKCISVLENMRMEVIDPDQ